MKILNLYAGIGGNRKLWEGHEVTAVESIPEIASIYGHFFPEDELVVGDAVDYLEKHFHEFDLVWASPPCQSHSRINRFNVARRYNGESTIKVKIPDHTLYGIINFLDVSFRGKWVVENTYSDYKPLKEPQRVGRHFIWSSHQIPELPKQKSFHSIDKHLSLEELCDLHGFDSEYFASLKIPGIDKKQLLRNCASPELGKHILESLL